jgi:hypothetical protein
MCAKLARHTNFENPFRTGLTLSVALASLLSLSVPSSARDGGAIAADVIDALGRAATPHAAPPPPPQPRIKYVPVRVALRGTAGTKGERCTMARTMLPRR